MHQFQPKYKNIENRKTKVIRVPIPYEKPILELIGILDDKYSYEKGLHLLRKYIDNLK
jgi:hypothetical protein